MKNVLDPQCKQFINDFAEGLKVILDYKRYDEKQSYYAFDYIDELEYCIEDEGLSVDLQTFEQMKRYFIFQMEKEYGYDNVYFGSESRPVPIDGRFVTVHGQMVIVFEREHEEDMS